MSLWSVIARCRGRCRTTTTLTRIRHHKVQRTIDITLHLLAVDDGVKHAVLQKEFAALKSSRKFLTNGLLNHPRPGKANERARFGNVEVAKHGEGCGHATSSRIGENGNVRNPGLVELGQRGGNLCQLH